jgi:hypothetical protein
VPVFVVLGQHELTVNTEVSVGAQDRATDLEGPTALLAIERATRDQAAPDERQAMAGGQHHLLEYTRDRSRRQVAEVVGFVHGGLAGDPIDDHAAHAFASKRAHHPLEVLLDDQNDLAATRPIGARARLPNVVKGEQKEVVTTAAH